MADASSVESSSDKLQRPFSQASITAILVAISNWAITDSETEGMAAIIMPVVSYGIVTGIRHVRKRLRFKKLCETIDGLIAEKTSALNRPGISKNERNNLESEIALLRRTKDEHLLADADILLKR